MTEFRFLTPDEAKDHRMQQALKRNEFAKKYAAQPKEAERVCGRPFILLENDELEFNPHYTNYGWVDGYVPPQTGFSVFLNFSTCCHIHKPLLWGYEREGNMICQQICYELMHRCELLFDVLELGVKLSDLGKDEIDVVMRIEPVADFDNGEIYVHFKNLPWNAETASRIALALFNSVGREPIMAHLGNARQSSQPVSFYGCGFRLT